MQVTVPILLLILMNSIKIHDHIAVNRSFEFVSVIKYEYLGKKYLITYLSTYLRTYLLKYLLTYLLHGEEPFWKS